MFINQQLTQQNVRLKKALGVIQRYFTIISMTLKSNLELLTISQFKQHLLIKILFVKLSFTL